MNLFRHFFWLCLFIASSSGCQRSSQKELVVEYDDTTPKKEIQEPIISPLNTYVDMTRMSIQELRIYRSSVFARYGQVFTENDLNIYWKENTAWYDTLSQNRQKKILTGEIADTILLSSEEQNLIRKIDKQLFQSKQENYLRVDNDLVFNVLNIANINQYPDITQDMLDDLSVNGFSSSRDSIDQLFRVYQDNRLSQLPSFITTDLMLQLSHIYYAYMLRTTEEEHLIPLLSSLCLSIYQVATEQAGREKNEELKSTAYFIAAFYAVPYTLLTDKKLKINVQYQAQIEEELAYIDQQEDHEPVFLPSGPSFPYSRFKPYGHYTRTSELRRYYKAMTWLRSAPYCYDDKTQLRQAVFTASLLSFNKNKSGQTLADAYRQLYEATGFLTGETKNLSILLLIDLLKKEKISSHAKAMEAGTINKISSTLQKSASFPSNNRYGCPKGVYFLPDPWYIDDYILHALTDDNKNAVRALPKGLDLFAALGSRPASDKLFLDYQEDTLRVSYPEKLAKVQDQFKRFNQWNNSAYNKWIECLLSLYQPVPIPPFRYSNGWNNKNISTSLASWSKLKHDVLIYGKVPDYPDPQDTLPKIIPPVLTGYVEPNVPFWGKLSEWIQLTDKTLVNYHLASENVSDKTGKLLRYISFMKDISAKEVSGQQLSYEELLFINHIGDSIEQFTLSMIEPEIDRWDWVEGDDRSVSITEQIYHNPAESLYAATSPASIYVIVETDGFLYLTRGAVLKYDEISMPRKQILTGKEWIIMQRSMGID